MLSSLFSVSTPSQEEKKTVSSKPFDGMDPPHPKYRPLPSASLGGTLLVARSSKGMSPSSLPPPVELSKPISRVLRFQASASGTYSITNGMIAMAIGGICTVSNSTITGMASSFRVSHVRVWPGASGFCALYWSKEATGLERDSLVDNTVPSGITATTCSSFSPPSGTLARMWRNSATTSDNLFVLNVSSGAVIDLLVDYTLTSSFIAGVFTASVASGSLQSTYYLALDGPSSNKLVPVALPTTS